MKSKKGRREGKGQKAKTRKVIWAKELGGMGLSKNFAWVSYISNLCYWQKKKKMDELLAR